MAIKSYRTKSTLEIAKGVDSKEARKVLPSSLQAVARRKLAYLAVVESLADIRARPGLGLHALKGERKGQWAIKVNDQYRICFIWTGKDAEFVEIVDYH